MKTTLSRRGYAAPIPGVAAGAKRKPGLRGISRRPWPRRCAFSLLEVILALAILAGSLAVLGGAARLGMRNAESARDLTKAQLLCESKLAEITAGITPPDPVHGVAFVQTADTVVGQGETIWLYSIDRQHTDQEGLDVVRVTVTQKLPPNQRALTFWLDRWIPDPGTELPEESVVEESDSDGAESE